VTAVAPTRTTVRGRPRDTHVDEAVHAACTAILATGGPGAVTVRAIADAAGVGAATIYRRWSSKDLLLTDTVIRLMEESIPTVLDAPIDEGVLGLTRGWVHALVATPVGRALPIIVERAAHEPRVADAVAAWHLDRRVRVNAMLRRAMDAGDLRSDVDLGIAVDLLGGPTFYRRVFVSLDIQDPDYAVRLAREFLRWAGWTGDTATVGVAS
jgi:AcrR family transcriptional regulator